MTKKNLDWPHDFNVIFAFPASGKSFMAAKYDNIIDLIGGAYKWLDFDAAKDEAIKGLYKKRNPEYPDNYLAAIERAVARKDTLVLLPAAKSINDGILQELHRRGIKFAIAYRENPGELRNLFAQRGNPKEYIDSVMARHDGTLAVAKQYASHQIIIKPGEYLEQALREFL